MRKTCRLGFPLDDQRSRQLTKGVFGIEGMAGREWRILGFLFYIIISLSRRKISAASGENENEERHGAASIDGGHLFSVHIWVSFLPLLFSVGALYQFLYIFPLLFWRSFFLLRGTRRLLSYILCADFQDGVFALGIGVCRLFYDSFTI